MKARIIQKSLVFVMFTLFVIAMPLANVSANAMSVSQTITITARVADMRSIVVNDKGEMIRIYSNTDKPVEPKVYLNQVPGERRTLTPELQAQYNRYMQQPGTKAGVSIDVPLSSSGFDQSSDIAKLLLRFSASTFNYHR